MGVAGNTAITAGTNTKITYDTKGLVTAGSAATTADIDASTNRNYVTDAEATVIGNTSGTNTGDQDLSGYLLKSGGTMTGNITMGANNISGTGTITATTFSGDITGDVTGNADTATLASTVLINYSSSNADAATGGTEYSSTASLASGTRTFDNGDGTTTFLSQNTFNAGIDLTNSSVVTIIPSTPAYYTIGGTTKIPLQFIISIDSSANTFTIKTYSYISSTTSFNLAVPDLDFTFNFQIFK